MAKYIECEAAYKFMFDIPNPNGAGEIEVVSVDDLDSIPATDVAPIRHGKWIFYEATDLIDRCSLCGEQKPSPMFYHTNYCPYCGAKMDGE